MLAPRKFDLLAKLRAKQPLQLPVSPAAANGRFTFGTTTLEFPGGSDETGWKKITHGLGRTVVTPMAISTDSAVTFGVKELNSTSFEIRGRNTFGAPAKGSLTIFWVAFG